MITRRNLMVHAAVGAIALRYGFGISSAMADETFAVMHTNAEWKKRLTPDQYAVLREDGTERPFTSVLLHEEGKGNFACAGCDQDAFASNTKFDSKTGWPSFWAPLDDKVVATTRDTSYNMVRNAVHCSRCGGHLGCTSTNSATNVRLDRPLWPTGDERIWPGAFGQVGMEAAVRGAG
jgi:peptide-methionine (R)-S-oxide reductase